MVILRACAMFFQVLGEGTQLKLYKHNSRCNIAGMQVRAARERAGLSQEQLAARLQLEGLNLSQKAISRIETGDRIVADFELLFLAKSLGVTVYELLGE